MKRRAKCTPDCVGTCTGECVCSQRKSSPFYGPKKPPAPSATNRSYSPRNYRAEAEKYFKKPNGEKQ